MVLFEIFHYTIRNSADKTVDMYSPNSVQAITISACAISTAGCVVPARLFLIF